MNKPLISSNDKEVGSAIEPTQPKRKLCASPFKWISIITAIVAIIVALACLKRTNNIALKVMKIPIDMVNKEVSVGNVVSIDKEGHLKQGCGTTIYRNIQRIENRTMYHLHTVAIGETIHVAQYDSQMLVSVINPANDDLIATETYDLPLIKGNAHKIDDLVVIDGNIVLSLGNQACVATRVTYENNVIDIEYGPTTFPIPISNIQPELVRLNDTCVIASYYGVENRITLVAGCLEDRQTITMKWGEIFEYSEDYIFHDIIGFNGHRFMVAQARLPWWTGQPADNRLRYGLGFVSDNLTVSVGEIQVIEKDSFGFMDMAQLSETMAILTFIYEQNNNGLQSILFKFDPVLDKLIVAGAVDHCNGGGSGQIGGLYSFIRCRTFSKTRFGVYYSSASDKSATVLSIAEVTPAGGLQLYGPEFQIAPPVRSVDRSYYWTNLAPCSPERFFIMESLTTRKGPDWAHGAIHVGEIYPYPIGIVSEMDKNYATVVIDGVFNITGIKPLVPGKEYMGNSNGELIEGDYVGQINSASYPIYAKTKDDDEASQILSTNNQVGYAIGSNAIFVRIPDNIDV